jgi:hypothetical protein
MRNPRCTCRTGCAEARPTVRWDARATPNELSRIGDRALMRVSNPPITHTSHRHARHPCYVQARLGFYRGLTLHPHTL